ncbi:MAG: MFS transporter [Tistrella sp.]|nr:cyclophilin-like fold protein [Tistrella sp.]MAD37305.1 MFS transporter [Tistrella sp.]MBA77960.1 MFS transporter [Tistrella sp.]
MQLRFSFDTHDFTATLDDTPTARDLMSMLPLDLTIEDYSTNEKIARLPRRLTEDGSGPFRGEAPGDLCYFAPWGNLAFFYGGYGFSRGLIRLGRLNGGIGPLLTRGSFPLTVRGLA